MCSRRDGENMADLWRRLPMLQLVGEHPQDERFYLRNRFLFRGSIHQRAGDYRNRGDPASIGFLLNLDFHGFNLPNGSIRRKRLLSSCPTLEVTRAGARQRPGVG